MADWDTQLLSPNMDDPEWKTPPSPPTNNWLLTDNAAFIEDIVLTDGDPDDDDDSNDEREGQAKLHDSASEKDRNFYDSLLGLPDAYTNPEYTSPESRVWNGPIYVTSDRFSGRQHQRENHLIYDSVNTKQHAGSRGDRGGNKGRKSRKQLYLQQQKRKHYHQHLNNNHHHHHHHHHHQPLQYSSEKEHQQQQQQQHQHFLRKSARLAVHKTYKESKNPYNSLKETQNKLSSSKYATARLPKETIILNPADLPKDQRGFQSIHIKKSNLPPRATLTHQSAPVIFRSRSHSPREYRQQQSNNPSSNHVTKGLSGYLGTMRRHHPHVNNYTEDHIAFFDIETDKVENYRYRPGEELTGSIKIITKKKMEIRFVELVVFGQGILTVMSNKDGLPKVMKETYLYKHTLVIGSMDSQWMSVLTAGHYTSKFRVKLPPNLPSSIIHEDPNNGFSLEVKYTLMARICDDATRASFRSTSSKQSAHGLIRVLITKKAHFQIQRAFDINSIPNGLDPVVHTEQLWLSCTHHYAAVISVQLDRSVFLAGDTIRLQLKAALPGSHKVRDINCRLQEYVTFDPNHDPLTFTLTKIENQNPDSSSEEMHSTDFGSSHMEENTYDVMIPTQINFISSYTPPKVHFKVSYSLEVLLKFSHSGGKLSFKIPITIGPCADPIYGEKLSSNKIVPVFNRTTRFPFFSTPRESSGTNSSTRTSGRYEKSLSTSSTSIPVVTNYSNGFWASCFLCCFGYRDG